jgi:hypothetical protein
MSVKSRCPYSLLAVALIACRQETADPPPTNVKANQAYLDNFGQPPGSDQGQCFARVGFYPLREMPGRVQAVPFFLFDEKDELPQLLDRLLNLPLVFPQASPVFNPFPPDSRLRVGPRAETLEIELEVPRLPQPEQLAEMAAALTETASQFADIRQVRLHLNGALWPDMPADGFRSDPDRRIPPGPPLLLLIVGTWEEETSGPVEILADFDRPVAINSFSLKDEAGRKVEGDYFTSAFDMALVIHPKEPEKFREGMTLHAEWRVTDRLGRVGQGSGSFQLRRHDHAIPL